jgi:Activator of Hsp90 ATPase homolog 1-like protein
VLEPIVKTIEVPCSQEKAFKVFVNEMGTWWPLDQRSMSMKSGKPAKSLRIEPRQGGKIVEIGHDDTEHLWGTIKSYDPYDSITLDFHMGLPAENASLVEVRFTALQQERTRVELTQSNWEAFGDMAEMLRGFYGSGWVVIFERAFKAACGG